jgi:ankyrin repeat protein
LEQAAAMLKAAAVRKYQKFWIRRAALKKARSSKDELPWEEEYSTLRRLCEGLLSDDDRRIVDEIVMDDLMERIVDDNAGATYTRLVNALQDPKSGFLVNCHLSDGSTPLHVLAQAGFSDCVRALVQHGADVNATHLQLGHSVLHVAAMAGSHTCMKHLINAGASIVYVNTLAGKHRTALHYAAERGSAPCLLLLLHPSGSNAVKRIEEARAIQAILNVQDAFGNTALHLAAVDGSEDCVRLLIEVRCLPARLCA